MLHRRYSTGFWTYFDVRIYQSSWICQGYIWMSYFKTAIRIHTGFWIWQSSKCSMVAQILNKILHHKYFTGFWICLELWLCQCYTAFCRKRPIINVWKDSEYSLGYQFATASICKGFEYGKVTHHSV